MRQPLVTTRDLDLLDRIDEEDNTWRKFKDIEDGSDASMDDPRPSVDLSTNDIKGKGKEMETNKRKRDLVDYGSESSSDNVTPPTKSEKAKTNFAQKGIGKESSEDDEDKFRVIHSRPQKPTQRKSDKPIIHYNPKPTCEYHDPNCSRCRLSEKVCEKQQSGGACVNCRRFKHKCKYARPRRQKKAK